MANGAWQVRSSRTTKFRTTKINSGGRVLFFTKICTPENYPLYGTTYSIIPNTVTKQLTQQQIASDWHNIMNRLIDC